jgi:predicted unusual protein kinase regulating ubiquinone biosynthesis (AarF/ABC1/UbiB family)
MVYFWFLCVKHGFLHADLHYGNFGMNNGKIVVYDFGFMCDIRDIDADERSVYVNDNLTRNSKGVIEFAFRTTDKMHDKHIQKMFDRMIVTNNIQTDYEQNIENVIRYIITKDVKIAESKMNTFVFSEKLIPISKVMRELEKTPECAEINKQINRDPTKWIQENLPYDDLAILYGSKISSSTSATV